MLVVIGDNDRKKVQIGEITVELAPLKYDDARKILVKAYQIEKGEDVDLEYTLIKKCLKGISTPEGIGVMENGEITEFKLEFDDNGDLTDYCVSVILKLQFIKEDLINECNKYFQECRINQEGVKKDQGKSKKVKKKKA